ncbi:MAG: alpha/beta hydrolase [Bacteroidetes bacterium]|nr:alpha/beta hydrolase [Bacteroidota bacterium]
MPTLLKPLQYLSLMMVTFSFLCNACISKKKILPVAHNSLWQMIRYNKGSEIMALDTAFLMVSNRHFITEQVQFADEQTDTTQQHILYIGRKNNFIYVYELNSLQEGIALFPKKNWVLYTEGMGKTFTGNIERATLMTKTYDVQVILFDYASINSTLGGKKNFDFSMQNALTSSHQYTQFLKEISTIHQQTTLFEGVHISLFLHSMGNLMFRKMMLDNEYKVLGNHQFIQHILFNAACVNRKNHHQWLANIDFAQHLYIHYNQADKKLNGAMIISGNRKLGSKPCRPFARNVSYIDFHNAVGNNHSYFLNIPGRDFVMSDAIQQYYTTVLNGRPYDVDSLLKPSRIVGYNMIH